MTLFLIITYQLQSLMIMASTKKFVNDVMNEIILKLNSRLEVSAMIERLAETSGFNS